MEARDASPHLEPPSLALAPAQGYVILKCQWRSQNGDSLHRDILLADADHTATPRCARVGTGATNVSIDGLEEPEDKEVQSSEWNMSI
jgi:hypothetical protein